MIRWILFSTLAAGLFYGLYCLLLRRDRWLQLSRVYLILTMVFSLVYPLVHLPKRVLPATVTVVLPEVTLGVAAVPQTVAPSPTTSLLWVPMALYLGGVAATFTVLALQFAVTAKHVRRQRMTLLDDETAPCSFFGHIIIGTRGMSDEELQLVMAHEEEHVRRRHSIDVLLMRLMCCAAWLNPFAWLMLRELRAVHEYQADAAAMGDNNKSYLRLLYRQAIGTGYGHITNNFKSINLKKRIVMMNKTRTRFGAWKVLAALPVAALLMMVGCKQGAPENTAVEEETAVMNEATVEPIIFKNDSMPEGLVAPEFPDGGEALYKYIAENIQYPEQAKADGIEGRVLVQFTVMDNGDIVNVEVAKGIGGGCDEEALRVVKGMPKWKPAIYEGKAVNVQYCIPINFKLK